MNKRRRFKVKRIRRLNRVRATFTNVVWQNINGAHPAGDPRRANAHQRWRARFKDAERTALRLR